MPLFGKYFLVLALTIQSAFAADFFVDQEATGVQDGSSWSRAFTNLAAALEHPDLASGDTISVAQGVYRTSARRLVPDGIVIRGGFSRAGKHRDPRRYPAILSSSGTPPALSILPDASPVLEGFTISNSKFGIVVQENASPVIRDLLIEKNGCGIVIEDGGEGVSFLENITFHSNSSPFNGPALSIQGRSATISKCRFFANSTTATTGKGGAVYHNGANAIYLSCLFHHNTAIDGDAGYDDENSTVSYSSCTIIDDSLKIRDGVTDLRNCLIIGEGDDLVSSSQLGSISGNNTISATDPGFRHPLGPDEIAGTSDDDYQLLPGSPAIDSGDRNLFQNVENAVDFAGVPRVLGEGFAEIDRGAFEFRPVLYVNPGGGSSADGLSWDSGYRDLQEALRRVKPFGQIWVSADLFRPDVGRFQTKGAEEETFQLKDSVALYGGFSVAEPDFKNRSTSVLSGDLGEGTQAWQIVTGTDLSSLTVLDGFTIVDGKATGLLRGGGLTLSNSSPTITNCTFRNNESIEAGGGIYLEGGEPLVKGCLFERNSALTGGAFHVEGASPLIRDCLFQQNTSAEQGAAIFARDASSVGVEDCQFTGNVSENVAGACYLSLANLATYFRRCEFTNNSAETEGGAMSILADLEVSNCAFLENRSGLFGGALALRASALITNCTFRRNENTGDGGGAVVIVGSAPRFVNTIIWDNFHQGSNASPLAGIYQIAQASPSFSHSLVQGALLPGEGNFSNVDPRFLGESARLLPDSPLVNRGTEIPRFFLDLDRAARVQGERIDLGAYEVGMETRPTDPAELLEFLSGGRPLRFLKNRELIFGLRVGAIYSLEMSPNLEAPFEPLTEGVDYQFLKSEMIDQDIQEITLQLPNFMAAQNFFRVSYP